MSIINAVMVPHPPLIIPEIAPGEEKKIPETVAAYQKAAAFIRDSTPDALIILTPHSTLYSDWFHISPGDQASGDFSSFGAGNIAIRTDYDQTLSAEICRVCKEAGFPAGYDGEKDASLDHAAMIPLYFLREAYGTEALPPVVRVGLSGESLTDHYYLGMLIREAADHLGKKVSIIASGDLSHKLSEKAPYGFHENGPLYDARIMEVMSSASFGQLFDFPDTFCEDAGECGHRAFTIMAGCFDGQSVLAEKYSYEAPFGVGYGICTFRPDGDDSNRCFLGFELQRQQDYIDALRIREDAYVALARYTVEHYVTQKSMPAIPKPLPEEMTNTQAGAFVSLHLEGRLRGCIGTIMPTTQNLASEIMQNAVSACSRDHRFQAVEDYELPFLEYHVDILKEPESIASPDELDVRKYGVIVTAGSRRGLLLPDLDGIDTVHEQIEIACRKGGIAPDENYTLERFEVVRHE